MKKITDKEIQAVIALPAQKRYEYGIKIIADWEELWSLKDKNGWVSAQSSEGRPQFAIWPHPKYAELCAKEAWAGNQGNQPEKIALDAWLSEWTPNMKSEGLEIGFFPTPTGRTIEISLDKLSDDLSKELEKYE
jgi:hypothetical protein